MYNSKSRNATEFISHEEILDTLEYARKNKSNKTLINDILNKASEYKGLNHREAAVLLECDLEEENQKIKDLAYEIKQKIYGNLIYKSSKLEIRLFRE